MYILNISQQFNIHIIVFILIEDNLINQFIIINDIWGG